MEEPTKKTRRKLSPLNLILLCIIVLLVAALGVAGLFLWRLSRVNQFSKNISLTDTYFLSDYATAGGAMEPEKANQQDTAIRAMWDYANMLEREHYFPRRASSMFDDMMKFYDSYGATDESAALINEHFGTTAFTWNNSAMLDVPYITQEGILPNGCEAVAATMLLQYNGYNISATDFVDTYLEKEPVYISWGCRYGPDPAEVYAGDPYSERGGWGCFAPVIVNALEACIDPSDYIVNVTGMSLATLAKTYVANGYPVVVWVTLDMTEITDVYQWQSTDGSATYLYPVNQHCMVLLGYDADNYYFADPAENNGVVSYAKNTASLSFRSMGQQAIVLLHTGEDAPTLPDTTQTSTAGSGPRTAESDTPREDVNARTAYAATGSTATVGASHALETAAESDT